MLCGATHSGVWVVSVKVQARATPKHVHQDPHVLTHVCAYSITHQHSRAKNGPMCLSCLLSYVLWPWPKALVLLSKEKGSA